MNITDPIGYLNRKTGLWTLTQDWFVDLDSIYRLCIRAGFASDGASIPRPLWTFVGPRFDASSFAAAFPHDALYVAKLMSREDVDRLFKEILLYVGLEQDGGTCGWKHGRTRVKAYSYWAAVRAFGWIPWNHYTQEDTDKARQFVSIETIKEIIPC